MTIHQRTTFCLPLLLVQPLTRTSRTEVLSPLEALRIYFTILIGVTGLMICHTYMMPQ